MNIHESRKEKKNVVNVIILCGCYCFGSVIFLKTFGRLFKRTLTKAIKLPDGV